MIGLVTSVLVATGADVFIRMHATTKAGTLGCGLIFVAVAVHFGETDITARSLAAIVFLVLTAPIAAHMISRAAYRTGTPLWRGTVTDELGRRQGPPTAKPQGLVGTERDPTMT